MHPVVGREKEPPFLFLPLHRPASPDCYPYRNFRNILESFYSLRNYPLLGCLRNDRASVMLSALPAFGFTDHTLTTVRLYDRKKRREQKKEVVVEKKTEAGDKREREEDDTRTFSISRTKRSAGLL